MLVVTTSSSPYCGFRIPSKVIEHAVWLYRCFSLIPRDVELILAAGGVVVSDESICECSLRLGELFANTPKRRRSKPSNEWHLDEVFIRIRGKLHYLLRAVDQHDYVLDILVQNRRHAKVAKRSFRTLFRVCNMLPR